jgi:hypothetical protein
MKAQPEYSIDALTFWEALCVEYPESILQWKPSEERWSVGQVYTHLLEETTYYLEQAIHCATYSENEEQSSNAQGQKIFAAGALPSLRIEGPASHQSIHAIASMGHVNILLKKLHSHWEQAIRTVSQSNGKGKTRHPGLGYFDAREWLVFAGMHLRHHEQLLVSDYLVHFQP